MIDRLRAALPVQIEEYRHTTFYTDTDEAVNDLHGYTVTVVIRTASISLTLARETDNVPMHVDDYHRWLGEQDE